MHAFINIVIFSEFHENHHSVSREIKTMLKRIVKLISHDTRDSNENTIFL